MEPDSPAAVIQTPSASSKKKKSKKKKKRKRDEAVASPIMTPNGVKDGSSSKKKKKERKSKKKDKANGDSSEQEQQASPTITQESPPISATDMQKVSSQTTTQQPIIGGSIISLLASTSNKSSSSNTSSSKLKNSPYQTKTIQGTVALLPSSLPDVPKCIQSLLNSLLLMYDTNMGGVLLSLQDEKKGQGVKLLPVDHKPSGNHSSLVGGRMIDDLPFIHYKFQFRGLLFCPALGMKLKGQVVECTPTYITLTTHHILSTKISTEKLHGVGFFYDELSMEWTRERGVEDTGGGAEGGADAILGPSTSIYLDDIVEFVVERIHECGGYISLDGKSPSVSTLG